MLSNLIVFSLIIIVLFFLMASLCEKQAFCFSILPLKRLKRRAKCWSDLAKAWAGVTAAVGTKTTSVFPKNRSLFPKPGLYSPNQVCIPKTTSVFPKTMLVFPKTRSVFPKPCLCSQNLICVPKTSSVFPKTRLCSQNHVCVPGSCFSPGAPPISSSHGWAHSSVCPFLHKPLAPDQLLFHIQVPAWESCWGSLQTKSPSGGDGPRQEVLIWC